MHIYAFGSIIRGDIAIDSDIDLLAIVDGHDSRFSPDAYSIYSYSRLRDLWKEGNPFAWHLSLESKLVFSSDKSDYLKSLGSPEPYDNCKYDCRKFHTLFLEAANSISIEGSSRVFDFSTIFLSIRNIATCYSLGMTDSPNFSRNSALHLEELNVPIPQEAYRVFLRARILCTRGYGPNISNKEYLVGIAQIEKINDWMTELTSRVDSKFR